MSPIASRGSSPPATPEKTTVRQPNRSASSVVTIAALTLPIPEPANTTSCPSMVPVSKQVCEFLRNGADQSDGHAINLEVMLGLEEFAGAFADDDAGRHGLPVVSRGMIELSS